MNTEEVIAKLRANKHLAAEIALKTGVPRKTLRNLWTGYTRDPRSSTLEPLRAYFQRGRK